MGNAVTLGRIGRDRGDQGCGAVRCGNGFRLVVERPRAVRRGRCSTVEELAFGWHAHDGKFSLATFGAALLDLGLCEWAGLECVAMAISCWRSLAARPYSSGGTPFR